MTITIPDRAFAAYDRQMTADHEPVIAEDWEPIPTREVLDSEVESWIKDFADSGEIEDEFGHYKSHRDTVLHAVAQQWGMDREKVSPIIGAAFWKWAKACMFLAGYGKIEKYELR